MSRNHQKTLSFPDNPDCESPPLSPNSGSQSPNRSGRFNQSSREYALADDELEWLPAEQQREVYAGEMNRTSPTRDSVRNPLYNNDSHSSPDSESRSAKRARLNEPDERQTQRAEEQYLGAGTHAGGPFHTPPHPELPNPTPQWSSGIQPPLPYNTALPIPILPQSPTSSSTSSNSQLISTSRCIHRGIRGSPSRRQTDNNRPSPLAQSTPPRPAPYCPIVSDISDASAEPPQPTQNRTPHRPMASDISNTSAEHFQTTPNRPTYNLIFSEVEFAPDAPSSPDNSIDRGMWTCPVCGLIFDDPSYKGHQFACVNWVYQFNSTSSSGTSKEPNKTIRVTMGNVDEIERTYTKITLPYPERAALGWLWTDVDYSQGGGTIFKCPKHICSREDFDDIQTFMNHVMSHQHCRVGICTSWVWFESDIEEARHQCKCECPK